MFDRKTVVSECAIALATFFAGFMPCEVSDTRRELGIADTDMIRTSYYGEEKVLQFTVCDSKTGRDKCALCVIRFDETNMLMVSKSQFVAPYETQVYYIDMKTDPEADIFMGYWLFMKARNSSSFWVTFGNQSYQVSEAEFKRSNNEMREYFGS